VNPSTEHLDLLDASKEVCVPSKDSKKDAVEYAIDVLDPSLYVPLHVVYYYHNLIWYLKQHKYEPAKTLFGFGYDFRQSNTKHLDDLIARLEAASAANNGVKYASHCELFNHIHMLEQILLHKDTICARSLTIL
jgi:hypothetical protein